MQRTTVLVRLLASGFVAAGAAAIIVWLWPAQAEAAPLRAAVAVLSGCVAAAVLVSFWRK